MENTMNTWLKIAVVVAGRIIAAMCLGGLLGLPLGLVCGALCGAAFALITSRNSGVGFQWDDFLWAAYLGLWFGAMTGVCVGFVSGLFSFILHSLIHLPVDSGFVKSWRRVAALMLKLSLIGSFGGGFSGMMIGLIYQLTGL